RQHARVPGRPTDPLGGLPAGHGLSPAAPPFPARAALPTAATACPAVGASSGVSPALHHRRGLFLPPPPARTYYRAGNDGPASDDRVTRKSGKAASVPAHAATVGREALIFLGG